MLGAVRAVTTTAADLALVERSYERFLGYQTVETGRLPEATALSWGAPAAAGRNYLVMRPESHDPTVLRFVEQKLPQNFKALTTYGWNATELLVADPDRLAEQLAESPFRILFPPLELQGLPDIRAMQVLGPAGEVLYLTCIKRPIPGRDLPQARSFVDRCFITVLGGPDMDAMIGFYLGTFANEARPVRDTRIRVLSDANGLPLETQHALTTIPLGQGSLIEIDRYPPTAKARTVHPGDLPPGMAVVSFEHPRLDRVNLPFLAPPAPSRLPPYKDHPTATIIGAAGELIELIEV